MKKARKLFALSMIALSSAALIGCSFGNKGGDNEEEGGGTQETSYFNFSVGLKSGASIIELGSGKTEQVVIYDNGIDASGRSYTYTSTNPSVATIDSDGKITPVAPGRVNFRVSEAKSEITKALKKEIVVESLVPKSKGGYNYSGGTKTEDLNKRTEILGKLEKYVMDTHLTGITLFENGGLVKYSDRVEIPTQGKQYIEGYGFGIITEGRLNGTLSGDDGGEQEPTYYHGAIGQDSLKINQYTATGSQVSDLASYITSSYWSTRLNELDTSNYEWYPLLATDSVKVPTFNSDGTVSYAPNKTRNSEPIPAEPKNATDLYRKWRIYVKVDGQDGIDLKYTTASSKLTEQGFNNRGVTLDDYEYIYQLLFTGSNAIIRGTEMANDSSYGIKGAQRFFNETKSLTSPEAIQAKWNEFTTPDLNGNTKLGLQKGTDVNGAYLDIELVNAIDSFTAMYTLSSNLVSPLPKDLFVGAKAIKPTIKDSIQKYGTFNDGGNNAILDTTLCLGAFTLKKWMKNSEIVFARNDAWFESEPAGGSRYHIPGIYYRVIDLSTDTEKNWKQLNKGNLDSAGVPTSKVEENRGRPGIYETKGDATFKLNVNSCTQEQWDKLFGPSGTISPNSTWDVKPWMSNSDFLDGLYYSIDRESFATKRGVNPSTDYFANAYQMRNSKSGSSYNATQAHKDAVKGYSEKYGYNLDKAIDCFRNAVKQLSQAGKIVLGSKENPTKIKIEIIWMYQTDVKEYGEDIKFYFEKAFNDDSVCGGKVKLDVVQDAVTNWEDVYNEHMMKGQFDLGFGAISGNTYNPLNFLEVLKSDNSSNFTLNWGADTSKVDEKNPIIYDGKKWSFDALWEVADHGGIVENGEKIKPVRYCNAGRPTKLDSNAQENNLYNGYRIDFPVDFAEFSSSDGGTAEFDVNRMDLYILGAGNRTLAEKGDGNISYDKANKVIHLTVTTEKAAEINTAIKEAFGFKDTDTEAWHKNPFILEQLGTLFDYELYYELSINHGSASVNYCAVEVSDN